MAPRVNDDLLLGETIAIIPYVELDGARVIPDSLVKWMWEAMEADGAGWVLFGGDPFDADKFLKMMKSPNNLPVFVFRQGGQKPIGVAWVNGINKNYCFAHFFFLKESWGKESLDAGRTITRYWLSIGECMFKVIIGNIPSVNRKAVHYVKKLGWTVLGEIPHMARGEAMTVTYVEKANGR